MLAIGSDHGGYEMKEAIIEYLDREKSLTGILEHSASSRLIIRILVLKLQKLFQKTNLKRV